MIYVCSDLHGFPLEKFQLLLKQADFNEKDFLFVLGDVIDRGENGVELLSWMSTQSNIQLIKGNHEAMLLSCDFLFKTITEESLNLLDMEKMELLDNWLYNGAAPTIKGFKRLKEKDPELVDGILDYLREAPLYECLTLNGQRFILVHAGLDHFDKEKPLDAYLPDELLWARPTVDTQYFDDALVIFGHTPTLFFDAEKHGKAYKTKTWICIDAGVGMNEAPMLLRLDDLQEFYLK